MRLSTAYHTWFKEKRAGTISKKAKLINVPFKGTLMPTKQWYIKPSTLFLINPSQQGQPSHCRGRAHTSWCAARCSWKSRRRSSLSPPGPWGDDVGGDLDWFWWWLIEVPLQGRKQLSPQAWPKSPKACAIPVGSRCTHENQKQQTSNENSLR